MSLSSDDVAAFRSTIAGGGVAVFPTDTLYGIACDPDDAAAAERIYELKGRPAKKPSAVMFFSVEGLLAALPELDSRTRRLAEELFPGPYTLIVANPDRRFAPACADTPEKLGLRVPKLAGSSIEALAAMDLPVMQTSANLSGEPDATALDDIDQSILDGVDLALDGGPLLGMGSTVADVSELDQGRWRLLRAPIIRAGTHLTELIGMPPDQ